MVRIWNQTSTATAQGKTAYPTWDELFTISVTSRASYIWGIYVLCVNKKPTANEATQALLKIESALVKGGVKFNLGALGAEGMTAHAPAYVKKVFIPWSPKVTGKALHHEDITFHLSSAAANTEGWDIAIQLVTSDSDPKNHMDIIHGMLGDYCLGFDGGNEAVIAASGGDATSYTTWGTTDATMCVVDRIAQEFAGILFTLNLNAETAGVPLCAVAQLTCTDIIDFEPQQHIVHAGAPGSLGTQIDSTPDFHVRHTPFPFSSLPNAKVKIGIADLNSLTGLTACDGAFSILWKTGEVGA